MQKRNLMKTISKNHKKFIAWNVYAWQATSSQFLCEKARLKKKNNVCKYTIHTSISWVIEFILWGFKVN